MYKNIIKYFMFGVLIGTNCVFGAQGTKRKLEATEHSGRSEKHAVIDHGQHESKKDVVVDRVAHEKEFLAHFVPLAVDAAIKFSDKKHQTEYKQGTCDATENISAQVLLKFPVPGYAMPITERNETKFKSGDVVAYSIMCHEYPISQMLFKGGRPSERSQLRIFLTLDSKKRPKEFECILHGLSAVPGSKNLTLCGRRESPLSQYRFD